MTCLAQKFISTSEGIIKKISNERRDYETVDEKSLSWTMSRKTTKKGRKVLMISSTEVNFTLSHENKICYEGQAKKFDRQLHEFIFKELDVLNQRFSQ